MGLTKNEAKTKENTKAKRRKSQQRRLRSNHHVAEAVAKGNEDLKSKERQELQRIKYLEVALKNITMHRTPLSLKTGNLPPRERCFREWQTKDQTAVAKAKKSEDLE